MQKIINRILILILLSLITFTIYKIAKAPTPISVSASVVDTTIDNLEHNSENQCSKETIEEIVKNYLLNNPQIILEAVEKLQKQKKAENEDKANDYLSQNKAIFEQANSMPWIGNENGDVTIISFYDYNCSYCKTGDDYIHQLVNIDKNVKVIFAPLPILGGMSTFAAKVALSIHKLFPEKFASFHTNLMHLKPLSQGGIIEILNSLEIEYEAVAKEMDKDEIQNILRKNSEITKNLRISGVPAYIIDDKLAPGLINLEQFQHIIASARLKKSSEN